MSGKNINFFIIVIIQPQISIKVYLGICRKEIITIWVIYEKNMSIAKYFRGIKLF